MEAIANPNLILVNKTGLPSVNPKNPSHFSIGADLSPNQIDLESKLDRYASHHERALQMAAFLEKQCPGRSETLRTCGAWLQFRDYFEVDELRLATARFCQQDRICPLCACRRAGKYMRKYVEKLGVILAEKPDLKAYLVTVTVRDGSSLIERTEHLLSCWRKLVDRRRERLKPGRSDRRWSELCRASGAVFSCEVKRGQNSGLWHPHLHSVWLCPQELPLFSTGGALRYPSFEDEWEGITGDSRIVHARPFDFVVEDARDFETIAGDFAEVFKYALKFSDMSLGDNFHAFEALHGMRLIDSFGDFRGVVVDSTLTDDLLAGDVPFVDIIARYHHGSKSYNLCEGAVVQGDGLAAFKQANTLRAASAHWARRFGESFAKSSRGGLRNAVVVPPEYVSNEGGH